MNDIDQQVAAGLPPKLPSTLRADCSRCAGLCCVAPAFYALQGFAFDKPADSACRHLTLHDRCSIHTERAIRGFPGCIAFDCYGAGQRVTQDLLSGTSWRTLDEASARVVFSAYTALLALHRLMALLAIAEATVSPPMVAPLRLKREHLDDLCRSKNLRRGRLDISTLQQEVFALLRTVRLIAAERPQVRPPS